jgi:BlaI family transcriptional regulator, penicillinase repressor
MYDFAPTFAIDGRINYICSSAQKHMSKKLLTGLELQVMNLLWDKEKAFVKALVDEWPHEPKPAYNTVSTVVRILEEKEFVSHEAFGRSHQYFPLVKREEYQKNLMKNVLQNVFAGDVTTMVSTLVDNEEISSTELDAIRKLIDEAE